MAGVVWLSGDSRQSVSVLDVFVFVAELLMLSAFGIAGARLGPDALTAVLLAIALPLTAAVVGGLWLAPRASRGLPYPGSLAAKLLLVAASAALLALSGDLVWAALLLVATGSAFILGERSQRGDG
ncbi:YrdB family protein [Dermatophilaceae bacterium Sec6.4]